MLSLCQVEYSWNLGYLHLHDQTATKTWPHNSVCYRLVPHNLLCTDWECEFLPHAVNCGRFCFWRRQSVVYGVAPIHTEDVFGPSLGWVWRSKSKVKVARNKKRHFSALSAACCGLCLVRHLQPLVLILFVQIITHLYEFERERRFWKLTFICPQHCW